MQRVILLGSFMRLTKLKPRCMVTTEGVLFVTAGSTLLEVDTAPMVRGVPVSVKITF